jgi:hypothetical protein
MPIAKAKAEWKGTLREGAGRLKFSSGVFEGPYSFKVRSDGGAGETTPEEQNPADQHPHRSVSAPRSRRRRPFDQPHRPRHPRHGPRHRRRQVRRTCQDSQGRMPGVQSAGGRGDPPRSNTRCLARRNRQDRVAMRAAACVGGLGSRRSGRRRSRTPVLARCASAIRGR